MTDRRPNAREPDEGRQDIDHRFLDENAEGQQEIVEAARRASEKDRRRPESSERHERSFDVEDPSHSKGSDRSRS